MSTLPPEKLRIVHCFRSPIGGVFRHVRDLVSVQAAAGHEVGILCDASTGGQHEDRLFEEIRPLLSLGLERIPMVRAVSPYDLIALLKCVSIISNMSPDVVHSHSAKGGTYGRMASFLQGMKGKRPVTLYCPHGGAMHYDKGSLKGKIYFFVERLLEPATDSLVFVSQYEKQAYHEKVGPPRCAERLVYNGLREVEFDPVPPAPDAHDFLYIGMMRDLKGPDVFLKAFKKACERSGKNLTAGFIGDGPDKASYLSLIKSLGIENQVFVSDAMPARDAFSRGRIIVVPSRAESMPYLVLEAIAASKPIVSTNVGGLPEIFSDRPHLMVKPDDPDSMADLMLETLNTVQKQEPMLIPPPQSFKDQFSLTTMAREIEDIYRTFLS